jgi:pilus assembly protein CpaC
VKLRVVVCEVNRAAARSIGLNFSVQNQQGVTVFANKTGPVIGGLGGIGQNLFGGGAGGFGYGFTGQIANVAFNLDATRLPFALSALKQLQYARSLAEPTLVTLNGQTANFLAGGSFPVPVIGGFGTFGGLQGVQYVPYGVIVNYTPYITDRDRLRLSLNATVSTRDVSTSTNIGGGQVAGLNSRSVNTTVELRQGETLAIAGLIEYNIGADSTRIPFIGDIPGLNNLTGLQRVQSGEKELVIFITPELVRPLDPGQVARLPGSEILDPTDCEFYLLGRLEGHCKDNRTPIRTDLSRIKQYHTVEQSNVYGPAGYSPLAYP